ncbi:hypothetical protein LCGC14_3138480, partial [marine sediment metagenome]
MGPAHLKLERGCSKRRCKPRHPALNDVLYRLYRLYRIDRTCLPGLCRRHGCCGTGSCERFFLAIDLSRFGERRSGSCACRTCARCRTGAPGAAPGPVAPGFRLACCGWCGIGRVRLYGWGVTCRTGALGAASGPVARAFLSACSWRVSVCRPGVDRTRGASAPWVRPPCGPWGGGLLRVGRTVLASGRWRSRRSRSGPSPRLV